MPAALRRERRPTLILLVYSACMVLVGITASAQAGVISTSYQHRAIESVVNDDAALIRAIVNSAVRLSDLPPTGPTPERRQELDGMLSRVASRGGAVGVQLLAPDGSTVAGTSGAGVPPAAIADALAGRSTAGIMTDAEATAAGGPGGYRALVHEVLPLVAGDEGVRAVVVMWRDAGPILDTIDEVRRQVVILTLSAAVVLAIVLTFIFHRAQVLLHRNAADLLEASRRDVVTGLLNHGAIVDALSSAILSARLDAEAVAVALVDIDNFQLLNDTHGHAAGDEALVLVATRVIAAMPPGAALGRYGPDEVLVFMRGTTDDLMPALRDAQESLRAAELRCGDGEVVPVSISVGLAECPGDAAGVTELLALAAQTLSAAKASGGDAVRTTRVEAHAAESRTFDVFQGLVIAIDTKDRYTKRHSEDVARYGLFVAGRLGLDAEVRRTLRIAGLLHDVGKIGIPDGILRKPGRLTADETKIVQQHVALGDMIVRDLPDIEVVRAGIRHHHERWDGKGYLHGLAGEEIPLVARILAVGDAFSAMTTTRPYRKALTVREALVRLLDAAGSQLDEDIVMAFVQGMERDPNAPLPGSPVVALWTPDAADPDEAAA